MPQARSIREWQKNMVNEQDRAKILAFVHGELDQLETQKLATRIESEEPLRVEFEALLAASDALEDLFLKPAKDDLSPEQIAVLLKKNPKPLFRKPQRSFYIAGGAVFAASLAFVLFMKMEVPKPGLEMEPVATQAPAPPAAPTEPATAGGGVPPVDNLALAESNHAATVAQGAQDQRTAEPVKIMAKGALLGAAQSERSEPFGGATAMAKTSAASAPVEGESAPIVEMKMGIIASRAKFSKNLNAKKALLHMQQRLDGKISCVPTSMNSVKIMVVEIVVDKTGAIKNIKTTPASPEAVKCLRAKLGAQPPAFKPSTKAPGTITIQLKNF